MLNVTAEKFNGRKSNRAEQWGDTLVEEIDGDTYKEATSFMRFRYQSPLYNSTFFFLVLIFSLSRSTESAEASDSHHFGSNFVIYDLKSAVCIGITGVRAVYRCTNYSEISR